MNKTQKLENLVFETSVRYSLRYGSDSLLEGCVIKREACGYYLQKEKSTIAFLGRYDRAVRWLADYLEHGKPNFAMLRS